MNLKHLIRYPLDIRLAKQQLAAQTKLVIDDQSKVIGLDLHTDSLLIDGARHLACLASWAIKIDSPILLRCSRVLLAAIAHKTYGGRFLSMPNVRWIDPGQRFPANSLVLLDIDGSHTDRDLAGQRTVSMLVGCEAVDKTLVMPYPMHPVQIGNLIPSRIHALRALPKAGVFFAGNQNRRYGRDAMQTKFHVLSRLDLLETLTAQFGERIVSLQAHGQDDAIVLRDSDTDPIPASEWMSTLASHQFFLCCPGAAQPVCHNAIEAMAVGVIPVIEYGDRFQPELMDGVNSICFQGRKGLAVAMRRISAMSPEKRQRMSVQAAAYYDEHLDGTKFIKRLRDELNTDIVDQLSMPFHDSNLFSKGSPASGRVKSTQTRAA